VDSQGLVLGVLVTEANASERLGAVVIFDELCERLGSLEVVCVEQEYSGENFARARGHILGNSVWPRILVHRGAKVAFQLPGQHYN
jgi:hypothetical protein